MRAHSLFQEQLSAHARLALPEGDVAAVQREGHIILAAPALIRALALVEEQAVRLVRLQPHSDLLLGLVADVWEHLFG